MSRQTDRINYHTDGWHVWGSSYASETFNERHLQRFVQDVFNPAEPDSLDKLIAQTKEMIAENMPNASDKFDVRKIRKGGSVAAPWTSTYYMGVYYKPGKRWVICVSEPHDLRKDCQSPYPEHDKFKPQEQQSAQDMIDWLYDQGFVIAKWDNYEKEYTTDEVPSRPRLIAQYLGIDYNAFRAEKDKMLAAIRDQQKGDQQ